MKRYRQTIMMLVLFLSFVFYDLKGVPNERNYEIFYLPYSEGGLLYAGTNWYDSEIRSSWIKSERLVQEEIKLPLFECVSGSPFSKSIERYVAQFNQFRQDSVNAKNLQDTYPLITYVGIDEEADGSYFYFVNLNGFIEDFRFHYYFESCIAVKYEDHLFFATKSLLGNLIPTGEDMLVKVQLRAVRFKGEYLPQQNNRDPKTGNMKNTTLPDRPETGDIIRRFTMFIPWREVNK